MEDSRQAERPEGPEGAEQEQSAQRGAPPAAGAEAGNDGRGMLGPPLSKESSSWPADQGLPPWPPMQPQGGSLQSSPMCCDWAMATERAGSEVY